MRKGITAMLAVAIVVASPLVAEAQKKQRDLISSEELAKVEQQSMKLLDAIRLLRPQMLDKPRGSRTLGGGMMYPLLVVVDSRRGDVQMLEQLSVADVKEVRYLEPSRAQDAYGINANGGAIVVTRLNTNAQKKQPDGA